MTDKSIEDVTQPVGVIAKILCLDVRRVQQLVQEEVIPKPVKGQYQLLNCVQSYVGYIKDKSGGSDLNAQKIRHIKAQADLAELAYEKARGQVVSLADLEKNVADVFSEVRTNIRSLPERVVSSLVGETNERLIKQILLDEIDQILTAIADTAVVIPNEQNQEQKNLYEDDE